MIDVFNIPNTLNNTQVFYSTASGATNQWQTWSKPAGCSFVSFIVIGGGGAGGTGQVNQGSGGGSGSAGGGSSSITKGFFPAVSLPDTLYIQVGAGGSVNPLTGGNGGGGSLSYISVQPNTTAANILLASGTLSASGGTGGQSSGGVLGAAGGTVFTSSILSSLGIVNSIAGQNGGNGGNSGAGAPISITSFLTGGAGGAGTDTNFDGRGFYGGNIIGTGFVPTITAGTTNTVGAATGGTGSSGYITFIPSSNLSNSEPFFSSGGAGGSSGNVAGNGGSASYGSGGGGGGTARDNVSAALGGRGGDGIVIITCI